MKKRGSKQVSGNIGKELPHGILSQNEILAMLDAITADSLSDVSDENQEQRHVMLYDFMRPDRFTMDNIRTIRMISETFAHRITESISTRLEVMASVNVISVDQITYNEFIRSVADETAFAEIGFTGLPGSAVLELDPQVALAISDLRMGASLRECGRRTSFTDIDMSVLSAEFSGYTGFLDEALSSFPHGRSYLKRFVKDAGSIFVCPSGDLVVLVTFVFRIGEMEKIMNLCLPYRTIEPLTGKLTVDHLLSSDERHDGPIHPIDFDLDVCVVAKGGTIALCDMKKLQPGDSLAVSGVEGTSMSLELVLGGTASSCSVVKSSSRSAVFKTSGISKNKKRGYSRPVICGCSCIIKIARRIGLFKKIAANRRMRTAPAKLRRLLGTADDASLVTVLKSQPPTIRRFICSHLDEERRNRIVKKNIRVKPRAGLQPLNETVYAVFMSLDRSLHRDE